jgi:hypothetical protein
VKYFLPVFRKFPVFVIAAPISGIGKTYSFKPFRLGRMACDPFPDFDRGVHPSPRGRFMLYT